MVVDKDLVQALIGSASALSGLTLVFLGFILSARGAYDAETPRAVLNRYRAPAVLAVLAFAFGVVCIALGCWWLLDGGSNNFALDSAVVLFGVQLGLLVLTTVVVVHRVWSG